ncbi:MAG: zinc ribbon domain-containing protein [Tepidisphaeraceae bacterium]
MGPTNVALVRLFQVDQELREALARLEAANKDVRVQERRANDIAERHRLAQARLREAQSRSAQLELDIKIRDEKIEKLRNQQQNARNNKEYQTFLIEINTAKVDRNKVEDETMKLLETTERSTREVEEFATQLHGEQTKLVAMKQQIAGKLSAIQSEIDAIKPRREEAASGVPRQAREMFDRMSERFDGEAMSALAKPDQRREEYVCTACNMDLVADVYNKLHSRDDLVFCPSCRRILFIPDDLPPETAIKQKKASTPRVEQGAAMRRQSSAVDVMNSIAPETPEAPESPQEPAPTQQD